MNTPSHDPYLDTAKRSLKNKKYKDLHQEKEKQKESLNSKSKSFLLQQININDLLNLPEGTMNLILFVAFLLIPYTVGVIFIFVVIAKASLDTFNVINTNEYALYWAIGYEVIATILILAIIKSAISFSRFHRHSEEG